MTLKSGADIHWQAARYAYEMFDTASPDAWYGYYHAAKTQVEGSPEIEIGGALVADLQHNLLFFGLGQSGPDRGEVVYSRFAQLVKQYELNLPENHPEWQTVFNDIYLKSVLERFPALAKADSELPSYIVEIQKALPPPEPPAPQPKTYNFYFGLGQDSLSSEHAVLLRKATEQIISIGKVRLELHGYTDQTGDAEYNRVLARRRSSAVYNWLKEKLGTYYLHDVEVIGHGEEEVAVDGAAHDAQTYEEMMAQSRRVVLRIIPL